MRKVNLGILTTYLICKTVYAIPDYDTVFHQQQKTYFHVQSYVDGSYNYLYRSNEFTSGVFNRVYDLEENGLTLQQVAITLAKEPDQGWGGVISGVTGRDANEIAPSGMDPDIFDSQSVAVAFPQAYIRYKYQHFIFKIGEMMSLAGLENYNYTKNTNFSRSILDGYAQSGTHIGLRGINLVDDNLALIASLCNGWSTVKQAYKLDTLELGVSYHLSTWFTLMVDTYSGKQYLTDNATSGPTGWRNLFDVYGTFNWTDKLSLAWNYDYAYQNKALLLNGDTGHVNWQGIGGYINYLFNEKWKSSVRGEIFTDPQGYRTGVKQAWKELTLSLAYNPIKALQLRLETRRDFSNVNSFLNKNHITTSNNQQSFALDALYVFS